MKNLKNNSSTDLKFEIPALIYAKEQCPSLDVEQLTLGINLILTNNKVNGIFENFFKDIVGISQAKFIILMYLSAEKKLGLTQAEIARRWKVSDSAISKLIRNLESERFVERKKQSKCENIVTITEIGRQIFEQSLIEYQRWLSQKVGDSRNRRKTILNTLEIQNLFL